MCHPWCRTRIHLHSLACTWAFHLSLSLPHPRHLHLRSRCRSINTATIHRMRSMALWPKQPLLQVMSPTSSTTSTTRRLAQRSSRMNPSTWTRNRRTRSMQNSTMSLSEKRYLHHCSFRSEKGQRTWDKLITLMKKVCCQPSPSSHTQVRGDPCTNLVRAKNGNQVATWKTKESGFSLKDKKEQLLAAVRKEIQKHELEAEPDRRRIQELNGIIESQRMEIDHTIVSDEKLRRDQLLLQEQLSEQNRDLRETCIRNMRDMEELQKSHVLKVVEEKKIDWRLWGSNFILPGLECQDSLQPWWQRREVPRCWDWRRAHQKFAGFTTVLSGARSKCEPVAGFSLTERKLVSTCTVNFLASTGTPVTGCVKKRKANQELENCQIWIIFWKDKGTVARRSKNPRSWDMITERRSRTSTFVILVLEVFKSWKNWREIRNFDSRNFREEEWSRITLKMSNLYAADSYFMFPVNQRYFLCLVNQEDCFVALLPNIWWYAWYIRKRLWMVYMRVLRQLVQECSTQWISLLRENILVQARTGKPATESGDRDHNRSWAKMAIIPNSFSIFSSNFWFP